MNSNTLVFVFYLLLVVVNSKSIFGGPGFQTKTSMKRILNTHPEPTAQPQNDNSSSIEGNNGEKSQNLMPFLRWKLTFTCSICKSTFENQMELNNHIKKCHVESCM